MSACLDDNAAVAFVEGAPPPAEARAVEEHLDGCDECRRRVSLLAQLASRSLAVAAAGPEQAPPADAAPEGAIGRFLLLRAIGMGAMGIVYAAYDPELRRRVALKLLRPGAGGGQERLLREAQAMARLQHPNVIAVHDIGTAGDRVFLAMELVDGQTLRAWLQSAPRTPSEIVAALAQAGRGLAAAHAAGLVHRDFKPDNVLVGDDGRVRVTDFGLAVAEDTRALDGAPAAGTPAYMAPEQHRGRPADARSDQFGFCVTLYEALCGRRPFAGRDLAELARAADAGPPPPPPRVPRGVARAIRRGLQPDPRRRFASMDALTDELARDRRDARRNLALVAGVAAIAAAVGFAARRGDAVCTGAEQQLGHAWDGERAQAVRAAFAATKVPYAEASYRSVAEAMERYSRRWAAAHTDACQATRVRGEQPEPVLSLRMACLDRRRRELQALSDLLVHADAALVEQAPQATARVSAVDDCADLDALNARRRQPADAVARATLDEIELALARVRALAAAGDETQALALAERTVADARPLGDHATLADALLEWGRLQERKAPAAAERALADATLEAEAAGLDEVKARALIRWVRVVGMTRFREAHEGARRAAAVIQRLGDDPRLEMELYAGEAAVLEREGRWSDELQRAEQAVALAERVAPEDPLARADLLDARATALVRVGRRADALAESRRVLALREGALGTNHPRVAETLRSMAMALLEMERFDEALPLTRRAVAIWEANGAPDTFAFAQALDSQGNALLALRRWDESEASYRRALAIEERVFGADHPQYAFTLQNFGALREEEGRYPEAAELLSRALRVLERAFGAEHAELVYPLVNLVEVESKRGRFAEAIAYGERAVSVEEKAVGASHPNVAQALVATAEARLAHGDARAARADAERALAIVEAHPEDARLLARCRFAVARALWRSGGDRARARSLAAAALSGYGAARVPTEAAAVTRWIDAHR